MVSNKFNVIMCDTNRKEFYWYDVIPYLVERYKSEKKSSKPVTFDEFKKFVDRWALYQWWGRCEYEIILDSWPQTDIDRKVDVYWQLKNNIDIVTEIVMNECTKRKKTK